MRNLPGITGMRGIAAMMVVVYHAFLVYNAPSRGEHTPTFLNFGWVGVDFFFVLSAFLLSMPLFERTPSLRDGGFWRPYLGKRLLRIAPPYYLSIVVSIIALPGVLLGAQDLLAHVTYLHVLDPQYFYSVSPVYWTLALEVMLYLSLPVLVALFRGRSWPYALAAALLVTLTWRYAAFQMGAGDPDRVFWLLNQFPGFLAHFALGIVAARFYHPDFRLSAPGLASGVMAAFGLLVIPLRFMTDNGRQITSPDGLWSTLALRPLLGLGFAILLVLFADGTRRAGRWLTTGPAQYLGKVSYSLYLFHVVALALLYLHVPTATSHGIWAFIAMAVAVSVVAAALGYVLAEAPSLRLKAAVFKARATAPVVQAPAGPVVPAGTPRPTP